MAFTKLGRIFVAASLAVGGLGWLYLFWSGVRVGDKGDPTPSDGQVVIGVAAIALMALGLIGLGISLRRVSVATSAG